MATRAMVDVYQFSEFRRRTLIRPEKPGMYLDQSRLARVFGLSEEVLEVLYPIVAFLRTSVRNNAHVDARTGGSVDTKEALCVGASIGYVDHVFEICDKIVLAKVAVPIQHGRRERGVEVRRYAVCYLRVQPRTLDLQVVDACVSSSCRGGPNRGTCALRQIVRLPALIVESRCDVMCVCVCVCVCVC